jgi:hypothetical protein
MLCTCYMEDFDSTGIDCLWCRLLGLRCLASNLRQAAGLCESFTLGRDDRMAAMLGDPSWRPGCGHTAPGQASGGGGASE